MTLPEWPVVVTVLASVPVPVPGFATVLVPVLGGLLAAAPALVGRRWLASAGYRYADEHDSPPPRVAWVLPVAGIGGALVALAWSHRPVLALVYALAVGALSMLSAIDLDVHRLPDRWTLPGLGVVPVALAGVALVEGRGFGSLGRALICGVALGMLFLLLALVGGASGLGMGDVKLAPSLGALLGFASIGHLLVGLMATFLLGGLAAAVLLLLGRGRKAHFAFGPFMALGALVAWLVPLARFV